MVKSLPLPPPRLRHPCTTSSVALSWRVMILLVSIMCGDCLLLRGSTSFGVSASTRLTVPPHHQSQPRRLPSSSPKVVVSTEPPPHRRLPVRQPPATLTWPATTKPPSCTVATVLRTAIPAVAVGLCWPLLSLQDTRVIAARSGTTALAALHPAVAVLNYSAKLLVRWCFEFDCVLAITKLSPQVCDYRCFSTVGPPPWYRPPSPRRKATMTTPPCRGKPFPVSIVPSPRPWASESSS